MKKRDVLLGVFMITCSLSAYTFLVQVQNADSMEKPLYQEISEQENIDTSPDVNVFKHVVSVFTELLPAS